MIDFLKLAQPGILSLQPYRPGKAVDELEREFGIMDAVKLASNENPRGLSSRVEAALAEAESAVPRYPDGGAYLLKQRLEIFLGVDQSCITVGNGSNDVIELLGRVFLGPETESIISEHAFVVYSLVTRAVGGKLVEVPAKDYGQNLEATLEAVTENTRMIFVANPNNPTGTWVSKSALTAFLDQVREDILVVLDEAYFEYVTELEYPNGMDLIRQHNNLVVTRTFSKTYGLAGLRIGYAISRPDIADLMNRVRQPFNVNSMSLAAALVALDDQEYIGESVRLNTEGMAFLRKSCDEMGIGYIKSVANFLSIDVGGDATPIYEALLREGVIVRPIGIYGLPNHLRVTIGLPEENARFLAALRRFLMAGAVFSRRK